MNAKTLAELALKVWGVTLVIGALLSLPAALWMFGAGQASDAQAAVVRSSQVGFVLSGVV